MEERKEKIVSLSVDQRPIPGRTRREREKALASLNETRFSLLSNEDDDPNATLIDQPAKKEKKMKLTTKEEGQVIRARAFLNRLDKKVEEKDEHVKQVR